MGAFRNKLREERGVVLILVIKERCIVIMSH